MACGTVQRSLWHSKPFVEADQYRASGERFVAEDDLVVVEVRGRVTTKAGKPYNNAYCFIFRISGGKIQEMTEYLDTELVSAALEDPRVTAGEGRRANEGGLP